MSEKCDSSSGRTEEGDGGFGEAALHAGGGLPPDTECSPVAEAEIKRQSGRLAEWAAKNDRVIPTRRFAGLRLFSEHTFEHFIYHDPNAHRAIKVTRPGQFGIIPIRSSGRWTFSDASPVDYLRRWRLFNAVFEDQVRFEGITSRRDSDLVALVISQPWRIAADISNPLPTPQEVETFLIRYGFEPESGFRAWRRLGDGIVLIDAAPDNFIKTSQGVVPIDLPMRQTD